MEDNHDRDKGKHCKDLKVFTDNIEEAALESLHRIAELSPFDEKKIRIIPDVHREKEMRLSTSSVQ